MAWVTKDSVEQYDHTPRTAEGIHQKGKGPELVALS